MIQLDVANVKRSLQSASKALDSGDSIQAIADLTVALEAVLAHHKGVRGAVLFHPQTEAAQAAIARYS